MNSGGLGGEGEEGEEHRLADEAVRSIRTLIGTSRLPEEVLQRTARAACQVLHGRSRTVGHGTAEFSEFGRTLAAAGQPVKDVREGVEAAIGAVVTRTLAGYSPSDTAAARSLIRRGRTESQRAMTAATEAYRQFVRSQFEDARRRRSRAGALLRGTHEGSEAYLVLLERTRTGVSPTDPANSAEPTPYSAVLTYADRDERLYFVPLAAYGGRHTDRAGVRALAKRVAEHMVASRPAACALAASPASVPAAVDEARRVADACGGSGAAGPALFIEDVCLAATLNRPGLRPELLRDLAQEVARTPELIVTLETFYAHAMDRSATARALAIHRNTVAARLGRVEEATGLSPHSPLGVILLEGALILARASKATGGTAAEAAAKAPASRTGADRSPPAGTVPPLRDG